ncbi:MAG: 2-hydroxychromene-2-carboxylate isomerase [Alphaproteobacteria bacterium]|nr:2-hydroxychromene-2-carboxylate isomerase [Alphaproteobacteria bacterium]
MPAPIDFYFDFSSPYGYLASVKIDKLAENHGRAVGWHPILLGVVFKQTGGQPLTTIPLKGDYSKRDFARTAAFLSIEFKMPSTFPIATQQASRAFYWVQQQNPGAAKALAKALFRSYFVEDRNISSAETVAVVAAGLGHDRAAMLAALNDPAIKDKLRQECDAAIAKGVFGSPYIIVDGEPFWGSDRLDQVDKWLETGGW